MNQGGSNSGMESFQKNLPAQARHGTPQIACRRHGTPRHKFWERLCLARHGTNFEKIWIFFWILSQSSLAPSCDGIRVVIKLAKCSLDISFLTQRGARENTHRWSCSHLLCTSRVFSLPFPHFSSESENFIKSKNRYSILHSELLIFAKNIFYIFQKIK